MPCVLPFQAPCTPPVPPSSELSGSPTRMLMFWLGLVPYSTFTWQYETFAPAAGMMALLTVLTAGLPSNPLAGSVASSVQCTGTGGRARGRGEQGESERSDEKGNVLQGCATHETPPL